MTNCTGLRQWQSVTGMTDHQSQTLSAGSSSAKMAAFRCAGSSSAKMAAFRSLSNLLSAQKLVYLTYRTSVFRVKSHRPPVRWRTISRPPLRRYPCCGGVSPSCRQRAATRTAKLLTSRPPGQLSPCQPSSQLTSSRSQHCCVARCDADVCCETPAACNLAALGLAHGISTADLTSAMQLSVACSPAACNPVAHSPDHDGKAASLEPVSPDESNPVAWSLPTLSNDDDGKAAALPRVSQLPGAWLPLALTSVARLLRCQVQSSCLEPGCPQP